MTPAVNNEMKAQTREQLIQKDALGTDEPVISNQEEKASVERQSLSTKHNQKNSSNSMAAENILGDENGEITGDHHSIIGA